MPNRRTRRRILIVAAVVLLPPSLFYGWRSEVQHNFGTLQPNRVYRSAQLSKSDLEGTIRGHKIKTVLNLRGTNGQHLWYRDERAAVLGSGATLVDVSLSSCEWMSRPQLKTVVRVLDTSAYPMLIHCHQGAERTGWVSAIATLLRPGATLADARAQFSMYYLYFGRGDGKVMGEHLDQYEAWLAAQGESHSPSRFREWVDHGFVPGKPSREDWPYDPYPLLVITRPQPLTTARVQGAEELSR